MNTVNYFSQEAIELADIRAIAEKNGYRCTSYKLVADGVEFVRFNVHFIYENEGQMGEAWWRWSGGTKFGYAYLIENIEQFEDWQQQRYEKERPASSFSIGYELFSLPYLVQFMLLLMKSHGGWLEDTFSEAMYTLSTIDLLPQATAEHLKRQIDAQNLPPSETDD